MCPLAKNGIVKDTLLQIDFVVTVLSESNFPGLKTRFVKQLMNWKWYFMGYYDFGRRRRYLRHCLPLSLKGSLSEESPSLKV